MLVSLSFICVVLRTFCPLLWLAGVSQSLLMFVSQTMMLPLCGTQCSKVTQILMYSMSVLTYGENRLKLCRRNGILTQVENPLSFTDSEFWKLRKTTRLEKKKKFRLKIAKAFNPGFSLPKNSVLYFRSFPSTRKVLFFAFIKLKSSII